MRRTVLVIAVVLSGIALLLHVSLKIHPVEEAKPGAASARGHRARTAAPAPIPAPPMLGQGSLKKLQPSDKSVKAPQIRVHPCPSVVKKIAPLQHAGVPDNMKERFTRLIEPPPEKQFSQFNANKDYILWSIEKQDPLEPGSFDLFASLVNDHSIDPVTRDYAVQHLAAMNERLINNPGLGLKLSASELDTDVEALLWETTDEMSGPIAGTALLALNRLALLDDSVDLQRVTHVASQIVEQNGSSPLAKATALQFCDLRAIDEARSLAATSEVLAEKAAAISCLGRLGNAADKVFLEELNNQGEQRFRSAVAHALSELEFRIGGVL